VPNARSICNGNRVWPDDFYCFGKLVSFLFRVVKFRAFLKFWLPVLVWMALIFTASSDSHSSVHSSRIIAPLLRWLFPRISPARVEDINFFFRKCCHLGEYAVLALLLWRALHATKNHLPDWSWPKVGGTLLIVCLYAASDEFHQMFVPTRAPRIHDVVIDTAGGALGLLALWIFHSRRKPNPQKE